jgi:hypothetical protein
MVGRSRPRPLTVTHSTPTIVIGISGRDIANNVAGLKAVMSATNPGHQKTAISQAWHWPGGTSSANRFLERQQTLVANVMTEDREMIPASRM